MGQKEKGAWRPMTDVAQVKVLPANFSNRNCFRTRLPTMYVEVVYYRVALLINTFIPKYLPSHKSREPV